MENIPELLKTRETLDDNLNEHNEVPSPPTAVPFRLKFLSLSNGTLRKSPKLLLYVYVFISMVIGFFTAARERKGRFAFFTLTPNEHPNR